MIFFSIKNVFNSSHKFTPQSLTFIIFRYGKSPNLNSRITTKMFFLIFSPKISWHHSIKNHSNRHRRNRMVLNHNLRSIESVPFFVQTLIVTLFRNDSYCLRISRRLSSLRDFTSRIFFSNIRASLPDNIGVSLIGLAIIMIRFSCLNSFIDTKIILFLQISNNPTLKKQIPFLQSSLKINFYLIQVTCECVVVNPDIFQIGDITRAIFHADAIMAIPSPVETIDIFGNVTIPILDS